MDRDFSGLLLLIGRLHATGQPLDCDHLRSFAELKLPGVAARTSELLDALFFRGLASGQADAFTLTEQGWAAVAQVEREYSLTALFYDTYYTAVQSSPAHSRFCAEVYGLDLCQHGMADMEQLHLALDMLNLNAGSRLFEFGCGDGRIAEYIFQTRGALVTGLDISTQAIVLAQARTAAQFGPLQFIHADILDQDSAIPFGPFDAALAVDSLFFLPDPRTALKRILARLKPGGRFAVFNIAPAGLAPEESAVGKAMLDLNRSFAAIDLTEENIRHWEKKKAVLEALREDFLAEGNAFLYKNRIAECQGWEKMQRLLLVITA